MLKYLIAVTKALAVPAVLLGLLYAYVTERCGVMGRRILYVGTGTGFAAAILMAVLKNKTKLINTGVWDRRIFTVSLIALLLMAAFSLLRKRLGRTVELAVSACAAVLSLTFLLYALPDVLAYPFLFSLNGISLLSTEFLFRLIGWLLGLILAFLTFLGVQNTARRVDTTAVGALTAAVLGVNGLQQASKIIQELYSKRVLRGKGWFTIIKYASNYSDWFIYVILLAAVVLPLSLWLASLRVNEPYRNPAEHRKIRARWRSARRWGASAIVCFALAASTLTWVNAIANRPVELSPVEPSELRGDNIYVPLTQVEDGHLHRFDYTTPDGYTVRFIVIKKPNGSSYGVGLDACDICGETGYFERDGQIVCKLCDVVMNVNTIGFKGGCNPIVIDYSVQNGYIVVPIDTLIEHQEEFKK